MNYDLDKFGLSEEELFSPVDNSSLESEKITAPRYSYWHSVFRVFFKKKINIAVLCLLGVILLMTYVYPLFVEYDRFANLMNGATKHLSPSKALQQLMAMLQPADPGKPAAVLPDSRPLMLSGLVPEFQFPWHLSVRSSTFRLV